MKVTDAQLKKQINADLNNLKELSEDENLTPLWKDFFKKQIKLHESFLEKNFKK